MVRKDFGLRSSRLFITQIHLLYRSAVGLMGAEWHTPLLRGLLISLCCPAQGHVAVQQGLCLAAVLLLFLHADAGLPKAVPQGSHRCSAHRYSLFWFHPHFGKHGLCSQHSSPFGYTSCIPSHFSALCPSDGLSPYLWWLCSSRMGPAGAAFCWQPRGLLGSIPERFTLSTLAKLLRKIWSVLLKILLCKTAS